MDFNPSSLGLRPNACDTLLHAHLVRCTGVEPVSVSFRGSCQYRMTYSAYWLL